MTLSKTQFGLLISTIKEDYEQNRDRVKNGEIIWLRDVLLVAIQTGMRLSEICEMRWNWVDLEGRQVVVRRKNGFVPKSGHERTIPVRGEALEVLKKLNGLRGPADQTGYVFLASRGRKNDRERLDPTYLSKRFLHYRRMAGLPEGMSFHSLRHSFCTWMISGGATLPEVRIMAGHADITTTMGYVHVLGQDLHDAVEKVFSNT